MSDGNMTHDEYLIKKAISDAHHKKATDWRPELCGTACLICRAVNAGRMAQHQAGINATDTLPGNWGDFIEWQANERVRLRAELAALQEER